jgi:hypothetical protein
MSFVSLSFQAMPCPRGPCAGSARGSNTVVLLEFEALTSTLTAPEVKAPSTQVPPTCPKFLCELYCRLYHRPDCTRLSMQSSGLAKDQVDGPCFFLSDELHMHRHAVVPTGFSCAFPTLSKPNALAHCNIECSSYMSQTLSFRARCSLKHGGAAGMSCAVSAITPVTRTLGCMLAQ